MTVDGVLTNYTYSTDGLNQLTQVSTVGQTTNYTYDARGNIASISDGTAQTAFIVDPRNNITNITITEGANTTSIDNTYDAEGLRIGQTIQENSVITSDTTFVWDPQTAYGDVLFETDSISGTDVHYNYANGLLLSQRRDATPTFYTHDAQGGIRGVYSDTGTVLNAYDYNAFGDSYSLTAATANRFGYTGQQLDDETGLYYLG